MNVAFVTEDRLQGTLITTLQKGSSSVQLIANFWLFEENMVTVNAVIRKWEKVLSILLNTSTSSEFTDSTSFKMRRCSVSKQEFNIFNVPHLFHSSSFDISEMPFTNKTLSELFFVMTDTLLQYQPRKSVNIHEFNTNCCQSSVS